MRLTSSPNRGDHGEECSSSLIGPETTVLLAPFDAAYVEIPKVACSSLKVAFAQMLGVSLEAAGGNPHAVEFPSPGSDGATEDRLYPGLFTFTFVRNPWDRLVSCYRDKIGGEVDDFTGFSEDAGVAYCLARFDEFTAGMSFDAFVRAVAAIPDERADAHFRSQNTFVRTKAGKLGVDFIGRFERLQGDFTHVARQVGLPSTVLPRLQAARTTVNYVDYYDVEIRKLVAKRFRDDIDTFGYEFGG